MGLNHRMLRTCFCANPIKRKGRDEAEASSSVSSDVGLARRGIRNMNFGFQIYPVQAQPVSSDSTSEMNGSPVEAAGTITSGSASTYKGHALASLMLESESKAAPTSFDRNSLDHDVSEELINQRKLELTRSHTRTTSPNIVQDLILSSSNQSEAPSSNQLEISSSNESGVSPGNQPETKDTIARIEPNSNLQQSTEGQNVFVDHHKVGPPPPECSQCNSDLHSGYCDKLRRFSAKKIGEMTNGYNADNSFAYQHDLLFKGNLDGQQVYVLRRLPHEKVKVSSEVDMLRSLQHPNIVTLIGYCDEDNHLALVFGFVCNRNLSFHLDAKNFKTLLWPFRANLAVQVAKGLVYLHENSIIHGNVNAMYLFLHRDFTPVIAQFPLARRVADGQNVIVEDRSGDEKSRGYLAPEYEPGGSLSMEQDVYAFGVVLFELVSGRPASSIKSNKFLGEWCRDRLEELHGQGSPCSLVDPRLAGTKFNNCDVLRMMKVAAKCTQKDPEKRPLMREVLELLMVEIEDLEGRKSSDGIDGEDQATLETHVIPTRSQVQPMLIGETEIERSQTTEHPDTRDKQVHWADPVSDAMNGDISKKGLPLSDMAGKFIRELRAACEHIPKVPLRPKTTRRRYDKLFYPSFNYYQGRIIRRLHRMTAHTTPAEKGFLRRPSTPGHRLHKSRPGYNFYTQHGDSSPPILQSSTASSPRRVSSLASLEAIPLSPGRRVLVFRPSCANSARNHRRRMKFENQRRWQ